jgi:hypothetical protein
MQYTSQLQFVVQSQRDQDGVGTSRIHDQLQEISSPELVIS